MVHGCDKWSIVPFKDSIEATDSESEGLEFMSELRIELGSFESFGDGAGEQVDGKRRYGNAELLGQRYRITKNVGFK